jgi:hypothetical protein
MRKIGCHGDPLDLFTAYMIRGIHMGEICRLCWLIAVFQTNHIGRFLAFPMLTVAFNLQYSGFILDDSMTLLEPFGLIWVLPECSLSNYVYAHEAARLVVCMFQH